MTDWPTRPPSELSEETQEAIAEETRDPGPITGAEREADRASNRYERWLDTWP